MYQRHREAKRISHVSYIGSVGGGQISQTEARQALQHNQNKKKLETWVCHARKENIYSIPTVVQCKILCISARVWIATLWV